MKREKIDCDLKSDIIAIIEANLTMYIVLAIISLLLIRAFIVLFVLSTIEGLHYLVISAIICCMIDIVLCITYLIVQSKWDKKIEKIHYKWRRKS